MADATSKSLMDTLNEWPMSRKISLVAVALLAMAFFAIIIIQAQKADYRLLYANLSGTDASTVVEWLKDQKIPYRIVDNGKAIHIPADKIYESRLTLAGTGVPTGGGVGFEIFDKQSFGMTDFAQKVNYQRALQGELARTISSLAPIEAARVLLALPEKRLLRNQQKKATASIIIKLVAGYKLKENQIQGILHLVAGSIEGLEAENVTMVDSSGAVLSTPAGAATDDMFLTPGMLSFQQALERRLENRAQSLLDRALGAGNSLVRVTAMLNFSQVEKTEEIFDPNTVPRSEQTSEEKSGSGGGTGGIPGVQSNLQGAGAQAVSGTASSSTRTSETINYEISKVVSRTIEPVGTVKSLSVAVLLSDRYIAGEEGQEPANVPRTDEEMQSIENMIRSALGLDNSRGDQINVVSMPFEDAFGQEKSIEPTATTSYYEYLPYVKYGLIVLGSALLYLLLIRPVVKTMQGIRSPRAQTMEQLETELAGQERLLTFTDPHMQVRSEILGAETSPTQVIKSWLTSN